MGAKGLSAEHVFVVGVNDGHIPSSSNTLSDEEISKFLVALSRTRQQCHLISYRWFVSQAAAAGSRACDRLRRERKERTCADPRKWQKPLKVPSPLSDRRAMR